MKAALALGTVALITWASWPQPLRVIDGDTLALGQERLRLASIDAPELSRPRCEAERRLAEQARDRLRELIAPGSPVILRVGTDKYSRTLAHIFVQGQDIGTKLIAEGLAVRFGNGKPNWCEAKP